MSNSSGKSKAALRAQRAAEERTAQAQREKKRRIFTVVGVVAVMGLIIAGAIIYSAREQAKTEQALAKSSEFGLSYGDKDAPHEIIIYEDFLCPFCGDLEKATSDELTELADEGKVRIEYRPLNFLARVGDYSERATNAFKVVLDEAGGQTAKEFHDLLFKRQPAESGPFLSDEQLVKLAVEAGASEAEVAEGITSLSQKAWVEKASKEALAQGLQGTPTILVDGKQFQEGQTVEELGTNLIEAVN